MMNIRKLVALLIASVLLCTYSITLAEEDPVKVLGKNYTLWDIPFGISKEELIKRFSEEKGITLVETSASEDSTNLGLDENQSLSLLGYPVSSFSVYCDQTVSIMDEMHVFPTQIYCYAMLDLAGIWDEDRNMAHIKTGYNQLSSLMSSFEKKFGSPTLVYYTVKKEMTSDSEYHKADKDFITENNISSLLKKNYCIFICIYFNNIVVQAYFGERNCALHINVGTSNSEYTWEKIKDRFPEDEQKPDPVELGI